MFLLRVFFLFKQKTSYEMRISDWSSDVYSSDLQPQTVDAGRIVLMDCGCTVHGYQSDVSRTWVHGGNAGKEQRTVWDQVHRGQRIAFEAAKIGASAGSVDDAVRRYYESLGYGPGYKLPGLSHPTGPGIGLEGHAPANPGPGATTKPPPGLRTE